MPAVKRNRARVNARNRGLNFERRLASAMGGVIWPGTDGDVDVAGYRVEAKYRTGLVGYGELANHIAQAQSNGAAAHQPWLLAITGGRDFQNDQWFILMDYDEFMSIFTSSVQAHDVYKWFASRPDTMSRLKELVEQTARDMTEEVR